MFHVQAKISSIQLLLPDHLFVSYDFDVIDKFEWFSDLRGNKWN